MRVTLDVHFVRPEALIDWEVEVPRAWNDWDYDRKCEWIEERVWAGEHRVITVEEFDE